MNEYSQYYFAFIDLLGFKELVKNKTCSEILDIFHEVNKQYSIRKGDVDQKDSFIPVIPPDDIHYYIMSDSICIYIKDDIQFALPVLIALCLNFQLRMLSFDPPILVRGSISHGKLYSDQRIIFGSALVDAYLREEKLARYPRIIIPRHIIDDSKEEMTQTVVRSGFIQPEQDGFYVINYIEVLCGQHFRQNDRDNLMRYVNEMLKKAFDPSLREKYLYLEYWLNYHINKSEGERTHEQ